MSSRREERATPYSQAQKDAHQQLIDSVSKQVGMWFEELFDKYTPICYPYHSNKIPSRIDFTLHQYENCGATFGYHLVTYFDKELNRWRFKLETYIESGYAEGNVIVEDDLTSVEKVIEGFGPRRYVQG